MRLLRATLGDGRLADRVRAELDDLDLGAGLPTALTHPDFTTPNALVRDDGPPVLVDWTNSGRGPRVASLGQLLSCTGGREDLVDAVIGAYAAHQTLVADEVDRLVDAIRGFGVVLAGWMVVNHPSFAANSVNGLDGERRMAEGIADRVRSVL